MQMAGLGEGVGAGGQGGELWVQKNTPPALSSTGICWHPSMSPRNNGQVWGSGLVATPLGGAAAARRLGVVPKAESPSTPPYSTPLHSNPPLYTASLSQHGRQCPRGWVIGLRVTRHPSHALATSFIIMSIFGE